VFLVDKLMLIRSSALHLQAKSHYWSILQTHMARIHMELLVMHNHHCKADDTWLGGWAAQVAVQKVLIVRPHTQYPYRRYLRNSGGYRHDVWNEYHK